MRLFASVVTAAGLITLGAGCSTITRGTSQMVRIQTDAPNSTVYVGRQAVKAPAEVTLKRSQTYQVLVMAPGRQSVQFEYKPKFDGVSLGNLIYPGGSIGLLTDFVTGADKKFDKLEPINMPALAGAERSLVVMRVKDGKLIPNQDVTVTNGTVAARGK
jgi:hypothetical protein